MLKVEIDFGSTCVVLAYMEEEMYISMLPYLKKYAKSIRGKIIEHVVEIEEING